jgi:hypothetical protein
LTGAKVLALTLTEEDRLRIQTCMETAVLYRWPDNVIGAKTIGDVLS